MDPAKAKMWRVGCGVAALLFCLLLIPVFSTIRAMVKLAWTVPAAYRPIDSTPRDAVGFGTNRVSFVNSESDIVPGWYNPGTNGGAVVILHGLGGNRGQLVGVARILIDEGWGVLLIDQRGHGEHSANLTTMGRAESLDALAAVEWLRGRDEIDPDRIGLYGASLGAATVIYTAALDPDLACAVADSSYADFNLQAAHDLTMPEAPFKVPKVWQSTIVWIFNQVSRFIIGKWAVYPDPVDVIVDIECPLFLIHGEFDERIDRDQFDILENAAEDAGLDLTAWLVDDAGHCNYRGTEEFRLKITAFFHEYLD